MTSSRSASSAPPRDIPMAKATKAELRKERVQLGIDELTPNPRNPRKHPEAQIDKLMRSIRRFGQTRDILATAKAPHVIVAGEGTWLACRRAGLERIDVTLVSFPEGLADEYLLADNALARGARDEADQIAVLLAEAAAREGYDPDALGFSPAEAEALIDALEGAVAEIFEIDASEIDDRFWISVRGPLAQQARALKQLQALLAELPGVDVELGTNTI